MTFFQSINEIHKILFEIFSSNVIPTETLKNLEVVYLKMLFSIDYDNIRTTSIRVEQNMKAALAAGQFWMNFAQYNTNVTNSKDNNFFQTAIKDIAKYEKRFSQQVKNCLLTKV